MINDVHLNERVDYDRAEDLCLQSSDGCCYDCRSAVIKKMELSLNLAIVLK